MISLIYYEEEALNYPLTEILKKRFSKATWIPIRRYGDVFNQTSTHFRLQKENPALILAKKHGQFFHPTPPTYGIGTLKNFYFSHLLNCPFDCRYCFLQAMYRSAHYVLFVNYEDFQKELSHLFEATLEPMTVFTGYDGDSLALEPITGFAQSFYPFFAKYPEVTFELRTKSTQVDSLLKLGPISNVVVAFSLNPELVVEAFEKKTPSLAARLSSIEKLQKAGFQVGLRFDPMIYFHDAIESYKTFFEHVFEKIDLSRLHSVTMGSYRLPREFQKKMEGLLPLDPLTHSQQDQPLFMEFCKGQIQNYIPEEKLFVC